MPIADSIAAELLRNAGYDPDNAEWRPLPGGGNNRLYRIGVGNTSLVMKQYVGIGTTPNDRFNREWDFLDVLCDAGITGIPRPVACDPAACCALYSVLPGIPFETTAAPDVADIEAAARFFAAINTPAVRRMAESLGPAADACFSLDEQLSLTETRLCRLADTAGEARNLCDDLNAVWPELRDRTRRAWGDAGLDPASTLPIEDRYLSPSDFGFHNALKNGRNIGFVDFEYAGWDDPAKTLCDFFLQPEYPVDSAHENLFVGTAFPDAAVAKHLRLRARIMRPQFIARWCCIVLNPFLSEWVENHGYTEDDPALIALREIRLARATAFRDNLIDSR